MPPQRRKSSIGGAAAAANPLSDTAEHTPPVSPLRDAEWRGRKVAGGGRAVATALAVVPDDPEMEPEIRRNHLADVLTMPLPAAGDGPLDNHEQDQLSACESSIDTLRVAFWAAGRALQIVRDGRLYRSSHDTFDDYVEQRWDMQRSYAHKLIRAWPLAAKLHPMAPSLNEGQVRELLPVVAAHGEDAAVTVYATLAAGEVKITAGKLREAIGILPEHYDRELVVQRLQAWTRGELRDAPAEREADVFSSVESRLAALTQRVVKGSRNDPLAAREFAAKLRTIAAQIEQQITA